MATTTTYLSLRKPETSDQVNVTTDISANMDLIDAIMTPATPQNQAVGDSASAGSNATVAKSDHKHGMPNFGAPANVASASSNGVATTIARSDHVHAITAGTIVNADVSATAEIAVSKLADGAANEIVVTASDGTTVQWAKLSDSHVDNAAEINVSKLADGDALALLRTASDGTSVEWGSAGQIAFPASQNASADANTLDDYEEGTWTPSIGGSATYTAQVGSYTKLGRSVLLHAKIQINSIGTGSVTQVSGLPFTAAVDESMAIGYWSGSATNYVFVTFLINSGTTNGNIYGITAAASGMGGTGTFFANGALLHISGKLHV